MLPLLNKFLSKIWPQPPGILGLSLSANSVLSVRVKQNGGNFELIQFDEQKLSFKPFADTNPLEENYLNLEQALIDLSNRIPQTYWPLQITLPDPCALFEVMEFDELPQTEEDRIAIATFRFQKEYPTMPEMRCVTQVVSQDKGAAVLLAQFVRLDWLELLSRACRAAGLVPSLVDVSINHIFNKNYEIIKATKGDGVLVSIDRDYWTILIWDDACRPRFVRSRWRDSDLVVDQEYEEIVRDVERLVVSYILRVAGRKIGSIFFCTSTVDQVSLVSRLAEILNIPCIKISAVDQYSVSTSISVAELPHSLLAVAVPRL